MKLTVDLAALNAGQRKFWSSKSRFVLLAGGLGSGKTYAMILKVLQLVAANPGVRGMIVGRNKMQLYGEILPGLNALLHELFGMRPLRVHDVGREEYVDLFGSRILLRTAHVPENLESYNVGWLVGDEIRHWPERSYKNAIARVRLKCPLPQRAFVSTPEPHWMADEFKGGKPNRELITTGTHDNAHNLDPDYIRDLMASYSKRLQRALIWGEFTVLEGAVFDDFDPDPDRSWSFIDHVYDPSLKTYLWVDPGYRHSAWLFAQEVEPLRWVVFDQLVPDGVSDLKCIRLANARGYSIDEVWTDPAADATQSAFGIDTLQMMRDIKLRSTASEIRYVTGRFRSIEYGIDKVRNLLGDESIGQKPRIIFSRQLARDEAKLKRGIIKDTASLRYPTKGVHSGRNRPVKDGRTDHTTDALRYGCVGLYLTTSLRDIDREIRADERGYRSA